MKTKILISALILCSFLVASVNVVTAYTSGPITDLTGDVYDYINGVNVTTKPHIDIKELICSRDYRKVTLKLTLEGSVKNQGDVRILDENYLIELTEKLENGTITFEEVQEFLMQPSTSYFFQLDTSEDSYLVYYVNKEVLVLDSYAGYIEVSNPVVNDNILTIFFNLPSSKENVTYVSAITTEGSSFEPEFSDEIEAELDDPLRPNGDGNGGGDNGGNGSPGFELIPLLIAIFIGVLLLKRKRSG